MPRRLTQREVITRLGIKAMYEAIPGKTQRELAALFHASLRTVNQAVQESLQHWVATLAKAPPGKHGVRSAPIAVHHSKIKNFYTNPPGSETRSFGLGNVANLKKVHVEDQGDGFDPDIVRDETGLDAERERQAEEAARDS